MPVTPDLASSHDALDHQPKSSGVPAYMTADQDAAKAACAVTTIDRLLLRTLWESGGRVSEVALLRLCDIDRAEGALQLTNHLIEGLAPSGTHPYLRTCNFLSPPVMVSAFGPPQKGA